MLSWPLYAFAYEQMKKMLCFACAKHAQNIDVFLCLARVKVLDMQTNTNAPTRYFISFDIPKPGNFLFLAR